MADATDTSRSDMAEVKRYLAILATVALRPAMHKFEEDILKTDKRKSMFKAFDGKRNSNEIAQLADVSGRAARDLINDLKKYGYVSVPDTGQVATVQYEAILDWFHSQASNS